MNTVYIGNLNYKIDAKQLQGIFGRYGKVKSVNLLTIPGTQKSRGIAFIQMADAKSSKKAIDSLDGTVLDGRTVKVSIAKDNFEEAKKEKSVKLASKISKEKLEKEEAKEEIIFKKKQRRRRGLDDLLDHLGRK